MCGRRARCSDELLYSEPPCTDYAELLASRVPVVRWGAVMEASDGSVPTTTLASSPTELFETAAGLPLLLTLAVLFLHLTCCVLQRSCGSSDDISIGVPRDVLHEAIARGATSHATPMHGKLG